MPRPLHARWILPIVAGVAAFALMRSGGTPRWREIAPGLEFATLSGEPYCRLGSSAVAMLRFDPRRIEVRVHHYTRLPSWRPPTIVDWQRATHATVVFNAGQFYPDWRYMGLLVAHGDTVSARPHAGFQAALVAASGGGPRDARVLDLAKTPLESQRGWSEVAQSFMLFDSAGSARVRKSDRIANRTIVGEDRRGRLVVAVSEGAYTLADFAQLLRRSPLGLTHAMSMDGGGEAQLVVATRSFRYASFGRWPEHGPTDAPGAQTPLPAVITLEAP